MSVFLIEEVQILTLHLTFRQFLTFLNVIKPDLCLQDSSANYPKSFDQTSLYFLWSLQITNMYLHTKVHDFCCVLKSTRLQISTQISFGNTYYVSHCMFFVFNTRYQSKVFHGLHMLGYLFWNLFRQNSEVSALKIVKSVVFKFITWYVLNARTLECP